MVTKLGNLVLYLERLPSKGPFDQNLLLDQMIDKRHISTTTIPMALKLDRVEQWCGETGNSWGLGLGVRCKTICLETMAVLNQ